MVAVGVALITNIGLQEIDRDGFISEVLLLLSVLTC